MYQKSEEKFSLLESFFFPLEGCLWAKVIKENFWIAYIMMIWFIFRAVGFLPNYIRLKEDMKGLARLSKCSHLNKTRLYPPRTEFHFISLSFCAEGFGTR